MPTLSHPHSDIFFPIFMWTLLYFSLCPLLPILSMDTTEKSLFLFSLRLPFRYFHTSIGFPLSLLSSWLNTKSSLSLSSYERYSSPIIIFVTLHWGFSSTFLSFILVSPELVTVLQVWPLQSCVEGKDHIFGPSGNTLPNAAQDTMYLCHKGSLLAYIQLGVH